MARACLLVGILMLAACSDPSPLGSAVLVGADYETVECGDDTVCIRVFSEVDGDASGTGSCILYAITSEGQVAVAASGALELNPGETFEWTVRVPAHLGSRGWDPACEPSAER